jgi:hypothetical protein
MKLTRKEEESIDILEENVQTKNIIWKVSSQT